MTGDMAFQIILFLFLLVLLLVIGAVGKLLFFKKTNQTSPDIEQKLDRIIELLEKDTHTKR